MNRIHKRILCLLLALTMLCGMMPMAVSAADETDLSGENPWHGRSAVFVGDSITAGVGTTQTYVPFLKEALGFGSVSAMGISGSCISSGSDYGNKNTPLINRYQTIPSADLIQIFMGTNDYGHATPLGTPEDTQAGTFYGALNTIIPYLLATHKTSKIVFVTPLHRYAKSTGTSSKFEQDPNASGHTLNDYATALKQACAAHGVSVIDLYAESESDPRLDPQNTAYFPDGIHPNAAGHELIAEIMASHIRELSPAEKAPETETELVYGNKFASGFSQQNRASSRINYYLKAGTVITLKDPKVMQWACAKTSDEFSVNNMGYFPDSAWSDKATAVVQSDGWIGFTFKYRNESQVFDLSKPLSDYITIEEPHTHTYQNGICIGCGAVDPNTADLLTLQYDDHYDITGKDAEIVDAGDGVVAIVGNDLVATGIGEAIVRLDGKLYHAVVKKAKIDIVIIMGQSNAGNHFANAISDVTCAPGTAYWWNSHTTEPLNYTQPSQGFHTPLLAELYAQSVAAGDPIKPVMVWEEGITSKNGRSITSWAASQTDTSGTNQTVAMLKNCISYYEQHSDRYEIVHTGVYWLQGESDTAMDPEKYTGLFMAMWSKLKNAGAEYVAFFRLRKGTTENDAAHHDLDYTGSLTAQLQMVNHNADMFMASTITENWEGNETTAHSVDIHKYLTLMEKYGNEETYTDSYGNTATVQNGILTTTMKELYGSNNKCHYGKFGYGLIGADAAYNMYRALHTTDFSIVKADTSGKVSARQTDNPGEIITLDITDLTENIAFRASPGSAAGTLNVIVKCETEDITDQVIATGTNTLGTVDVNLLRKYDNPVIIVTYTPIHGTAGYVTYQVTNNAPKHPNVYHWDFEQDLYARNENGEIVNAFDKNALLGHYTLEDGKLKATNLQLAINNSIRLDETQNWSVEWKLGEVTDQTTGFLLCNTENSTIGTKTIYMTTTGKTTVSEYANSTGYRNFYTNDTHFSSGDVLKITHRYDSEKQRSVLSLWINEKLAVADYQYKGAINKTNDTPLDMSGYPLSGNFVFNYLGCKGIAAFSVTCEIDYIKITTHAEDTDSDTTPPSTNIKMGDLNNDGLIDTADVVSLRRHIAGGYDVKINPTAADVNGDTVLDTTDVVWLRRYIAGGYGIVLSPPRA